MIYKIDLDDFSEFITGEQFTNISSNKRDISQKFCSGYVKQEAINNNIVLVKSNLKFKNNTSIISPSMPINESILTLTIPVSKDFIYTYESSRSKYQYSIKENSTDIIISNNFQGTSNIKKDINMKTIQINIKKKFLLENFSELYRNKINSFFEIQEDILKLSSHTTNIKTLICANELLNKDNEEYGALFTQSKVLEILSYELPLLFKAPVKKRSNIKFSEYDMEALRKARIILTDNYQNPPSIIELSKLVKLNEFKLKLGYKNKYGETPYKTILNYRMVKGKELLEKSELNVNEVAEYLGYKQSCNFTKAFIERYNIRPRDLIKSRKYYY